MWNWLQSLSGGAPTFIGSVLGFAFLILGALFNFQLNRWRDDYLRSKEAQAIAAALYAEIISLRKELGYVARSVSRTYISVGTQRNPLQKFDSELLRENKLSETFLYKALAPNIGLLDSNLVFGISQFYTNFEDVRRWMPELIEEKDRNIDYSVLVVLKPARDAIVNVIPTLKAIENLINIRNTAGIEEINIGKTEGIIEREEEIFEN